MKDLTIRKANQSDAIAITTILQNLGWFAHLNMVTSEQAAQQQAAQQQITEQIEQQIRLCYTDNSHSIYVAEKYVAEKYVAENSDRSIVGYIAVHWLPYLFLASPEGYISELFVHSDYRRQGIGQSLLKTVVSEAADRSCSRLMLVNSKDRESYQRQFYVKQGWRERENIANFVCLI